METPEFVPATLPERVGTPEIDLFKIAGKSISGWVVVSPNLRAFWSVRKRNDRKLRAIN
jgi:hypothetical protein